MQLVGIVGSGSTTTYAPVIIWDRVEHLAKEEQLVVVHDEKRGMKYLGVLRSARRYEPFLSTYRRTSYVDNPSLADMGTLPHTSAYAALIGVVGSGSLTEVQLPPNPGSKVYVVEGVDDIGIDLGEGLVVGKHKYSGIEVPLSPRWLPYHLAVVGATGTGKSRLVKALIDEVLSKTDYSIIVFDHTGLDYVRYYPGRVVEASRVVLDVSLVADLMLERSGLSLNTYDQYFITSVLYYIYKSLPDEARKKVFASEGEERRGGLGLGRSLSLQEFLNKLDKVDYGALLEVLAEEKLEWDKKAFKEVLGEVARRFAKGRESVIVRLGVSVDIRLGEGSFSALSGRDLLPSVIVDEALEEKLVVVDLSTEELVTRRYVVASVISELWRRIELSREPVNTVVVIDEAHNYACRYCGEAKSAISRVAREGRKWGLGAVLVTQRIIDLDPDIRGNINTWFFSKLQTPSDFSELSGYMNLAGISEQSLAILGSREFYVAGLMNPLKIPVLLKVREVEDAE